MMSYIAMKTGFAALEENRWYWEIDNDYSHKFRIVEDVVKHWKNRSKVTRQYASNLLGFILKANDRIFGSERPEYSGKRHVGDIVMHHGHECRVTGVWSDDGKDGLSIVPTGGYGFEVDIYEEQL